MSTLIKSELELLDILKRHDFHTYIHSISVATTLIKFGRYLKLSSNDISSLEKIGLFHDIGKVKIDSSILNKTSHLTSEEWSKIQNHPFYGYDILEKESIVPNAKQAILEHHENFDGTGYPYIGLRVKISLFTVE